MSQAYKVKKTVIAVGSRKGETVYTPKLITYGKKSTEDAASQISEESSLTEAEVLGVLNRYKRYVIERLKDGYCVELLGFGTIYTRMQRSGSVESAEEVNSSLIKTLLPGFRPYYTVINGNRSYTLMPDKISLVKVDDLTGEELNDDGSTSGSGSSDSGSSDSGSDSTGSGESNPL